MNSNRAYASKPFLVSILGPTAIGKTSLSIKLAKHFKTEIISADSRQFFKELNIGTAKASKEELSLIPHHFVNNLSISENYNANDFEKEVLNFLSEFFKKHKVAFMCGGSGMYLDAVNQGFDKEIPDANPEIRLQLETTLKNKGISALQEQLKSLDPDFYSKIDRNNTKRLIRAIEVCLITGKPYSVIRKGRKQDRPFNRIKVGLNTDRTLLYQRINQRVDEMIKKGLLDEVKSVVNHREKNALKTVGYREFFDYLDGRLTFEEAIEKIKVNSRRYAKRQLTWFKKDREIKWFQPTEYKEIITYLETRIEDEQS